MKTKNNFELDFNKNLSIIIFEKINDINEYSNILRKVLPRLKNTEKIFNFRLTDDRLILEIYDLFGENCISDRTLKNIKYAYTSSSTFNVFIIIYSLNSIIDSINDEIDKSKSSLKKISKITLEDIMRPLNG